MTAEVEVLFIGLFAISISSLVKHLFSYLAHSLNLLVVLLLSVVGSVQAFVSYVVSNYFLPIASVSSKPLLPNQGVGL